jgi:GntR family transcriptional regulator, carbon starvation induced regulator
MNFSAPLENGLTKANAAYLALYDEIMSCKLAPGSKININEAALRLGLSPGAVREALSRLTAERMTVATAQKGFSVADVSAKELRDLTRTRITIEQLCLRGAIENGDVEWETAAVATYHRLHRIPVYLGDPPRLNPAWAEAHTAFHSALAAGCGSGWMLTLREMLYVQAERYRYLSVALARGPRDVDVEHKAILDAALARDPDTACRLLGEHLALTSTIILESSILDRRSRS